MAEEKASTEESIVVIRPFTHVSQDRIDGFMSSLSCNARLLRPWDDEYMVVNNPWNAAFDAVTPSFILMVQTEDDVVCAVNFCRNNGLIITPRAGRHNLGGFSTVENGFIIDFREMISISIDLDSNIKTVTISPGCVGQNVEDYLWQNAIGYAIMGVMDPSIGVYGAMLGIGHGFLQRKLGTGTDNIIQIKIVLASGQIVIANNVENKDLFYSRGTHSNMGIVVSLTLRLHSIIDPKQGKEVYHAFMFMDIKYGEEIFNLLNCILNDKHCPHSLVIINEIIQMENKWVARITWSHYIDFKQFKTENAQNEEAEKWSKPIKELMVKYKGKYIVPFEFVTHYEHQTKFVNLPQRLTWYVSAGFTDDKNMDIVYHKLYNHYTSSPPQCAHCDLFMMSYGGILDERDSLNASSNPAGKGIKWLIMYWSLYENDDNDDKNGQIVREFTRYSFNAIKPNLIYGYVNGIAYDQNSHYFARFVYGENYEKLTKIKQRYDPHNLFRNNLNILPNDYYKFGVKQKNIKYEKPN